MSLHRFRYGVVALLLATSAASGWSQEYDFGPAKDSTAKMSQLDSAIAASRTQISGLFFGPGNINVSCDYKCFLGMCLYTQKFYYNVSFANWKPSFDNMLNRQQQQSIGFTNNYQTQFRTWVNSVNDINSKLQTVSGQVTQLQANIINLPADQVASQRRALGAQLSDIAGQIKQSSAQVQQMMQGVAIYLKQQTDNQNALAQQKNNFQSNVNTEVGKMQRFIDQQPCSGDAWDQFNNFKTRINSSIDATGTTINNLRASALASDQAGSVLIGSMTNMANRVNLVTNQLAQAQTVQATNAAIASLHITVAAQAWRDFSTYANSQIGK